MVEQGGAYKIVAPFVASPLRYGVYVAADNDAVAAPGDLEGRVFAISRRGSLSHVMTYLHTTQVQSPPPPPRASPMSHLTAGRTEHVAAAAAARARFAALGAPTGRGLPPPHFLPY